MKKLVVFASLLITSTVFANESIETRSSRTGKESPIYLTVSSCSVPNLGTFYGTVSSNFEYKVCREYRTAQYSVTGSNWNKTRTEIPGTATLTYKLETERKSSSIYMASDENGNYDPVAFILNMNSVTTNCGNMRQLVLQQQVRLESTPCN